MKKKICMLTLAVALSATALVGCSSDKEADQTEYEGESETSGDLEMIPENASGDAEGETEGTETPEAEGETEGTETPEAEGETEGTEASEAEGETEGTETPEAEGEAEGTNAAEDANVEE